MLVHAKTIIRKAKQKNYAIGAFNFYNFETLTGVVAAAARKKSPIILETSEGNVKYMGLDNLMALVESVASAEGKKIPIALHLDHGHDYRLIVDCIRAGFSSIHIDGSALPWSRNVAITKRVVQFAHKHNVWVQGELGSIMGKKGLRRKKGKYLFESMMTDPKRAKEFVRATGVDTLAISVGTLHGLYRGREKIDFKRLREIRRQVSLPLVVHGTSGLSARDITKAIGLGVRVFNIATEVRKSFWESLRKGLNKKDGTYNLRRVLVPTQQAVAKRVEYMINLLASKNKA